MLHCKKCGLSENLVGRLYACVDLTDMLCDNCLYLFNEWCDTHRGEPFQNFIQPKPWAPRTPGMIVVTRFDGGAPYAVLTNYDEVEDMYFDMTDETVA